MEKKREIEKRNDIFTYSLILLSNSIQSIECISTTSDHSNGRKGSLSICFEFQIVKLWCHLLESLLHEHKKGFPFWKKKDWQGLEFRNKGFYFIEVETGTSVPANTLQFVFEFFFVVNPQLNSSTPSFPSTFTQLVEVDIFFCFGVQAKENERKKLNFFFFTPFSTCGRN